MNYTADASFETDEEYAIILKTLGACFKRRKEQTKLIDNSIVYGDWGAQERLCFSLLNSDADGGVQVARRGIQERIATLLEAMEAKSVHWSIRDKRAVVFVVKGGHRQYRIVDNLIEKFKLLQRGRLKQKSRNIRNKTAFDLKEGS